MTDARIPERFLNDRRLRSLSDAEFRTFISSLVWAVSNRTDGHIQKADLIYIPDTDSRHSGRMVEVGLWAVARNGDWLIVDFERTQTSRAQLEGLELKKQQDASRSKRYRQRQKGETAGTLTASEGQENLTARRSPLTEEEKDQAWNHGLRKLQA